MTFAFQNLPRDFALDDNLAALPAAKLYVYDAGTSTPRTIYSNAAGSATHTNPLVADSAGRFAAWFLDPDDGDYKVVLKTSADVTIYTVDNLPVTPITATSESTPSAPWTPVNVKTSSFTLDEDETGEVQNIDPTSGDVTVTLPSATTITDGYQTILRHKGTSGAIIITDGGSFRRILRTPGESVTLVSDAVHWYMIAEGGELAIASHGDIIVADRLATPPTAPSPGTRYLATSGATSPWTEDYIYEANGSGGWIQYIPASGWACWVTDEELRTVYDGSDWTDWSNTTAPTTSVLKTARYELQASNGTGGGTPTAGAWTNDTLAGWVEVSNTTSTVTMATGVWTFAAGTYLITHTRSFYNCNDAQARFKSTTTSTALTSNSIYLNNGSSVGGTVSHQSILTLASGDTFSPQYLAGFAAANGLGLANGSLSETERYGTISIVDLTSIQGPQGIQGANGSGYGGTSTSSVAIGSSGTKTWTTQSGYAYVTGQRVRVSYDASNYIEGTVSSYSGTTFSITADSSLGSGTYTSWTIGIAGQPGADGSAGSTGSAGAGYGGTSAASVALITGSVTWSVASGLAYVAGQRVRVSYDGSNYAEGTITSYSAPNLTVNVDRVVGSGTYSSWTIGLAGDVGATGAAGTTGATGPNTGLDYAFNTATSGDPGSGKLLFDNATPASVTSINISKTGRNAESLGTLIGAQDDSTNTAHRGHLRVFTVSDRTKFIEVEYTGTFTDNSTYWTIPVSSVSASGSLPANNDVLAVMFDRTGNVGATGATGATGSTGATGPTGPAWDAWQGAWVTATGYAVNDAVENNGSSYICTQAHTSGGSTEPGTGGSWASYWDVLAERGADGAGTGDLVGPASATDNAVVRFDGTTGKLVQTSAVTIADTTGDIAGTGAITPASNDGGALGSASLSFSDLFLASGGVLNWNNGDVTITHSSNALAVAGADSGVGISHSGAVENHVLTTTHSGNGFKWAHGNTNFIGSLGALSGGGAPFIALHAEHGTSANTLRNSGAGVKGMYFSYDGTTLEIKFNGVATASADFSAVVTGLSMTTAGAVTFASDITNGTSAKVTTGTIELGHASDTTLARSSAGVVTIEGEAIHTNSTSRTVTAAGIELGHATDTTITRTAAGAIAVEGVGVALNSTSLAHTASTIELGHASDTTLSRSAAGELAVEGTLVKKVGKETICIQAGAWEAGTTGSAAAGTIEHTAGSSYTHTYDFDGTTKEYLYKKFSLPKSYNDGTITFLVKACSSSATSTTARFGLAAAAVSSGEGLAVTYGTAQYVTVTNGGTANQLKSSAESSAITIAGSPAAGDLIAVRLERDPGDASDTMSEDARMIEVQIFFTTDASTDA